MWWGLCVWTRAQFLFKTHTCTEDGNGVFGSKKHKKWDRNSIKSELQDQTDGFSLYESKQEEIEKLMGENIPLWIRENTLLVRQLCSHQDSTLNNLASDLWNQFPRIHKTQDVTDCSDTYHYIKAHRPETHFSFTLPFIVRSSYSRSPE